VYLKKEEEKETQKITKFVHKDSAVEGKNTLNESLCEISSINIIDLYITICTKVELNSINLAMSVLSTYKLRAVATVFLISCSLFKNAGAELYGKSSISF
jgi:hypothetical protein